MSCMKKILLFILSTDILFACSQIDISIVFSGCCFLFVVLFVDGVVVFVVVEKVVCHSQLLLLLFEIFPLINGNLPSSLM